MKHIDQVSVFCFLLTIATAIQVRFALDTSSNYFGPSFEEGFYSEETFFSEAALFSPVQKIDESYNPFSDEFRFHSLYENLPETNYQSLGKELASFIPNENRNYFTIPILRDKLIASLLNKLPAQDKFANLVSEANIFNKLGLYENFTDTRSGYTFQLNKNPNYCNEVDVLNLIYPSNLYHHYGVVDTYFRTAVREMLANVSDVFYIPKSKDTAPLTLPTNVSVMFGSDTIDLNYDVIRSVGLNHNCISQSYSSVKGVTDIATKHLFVKFYENYKQKNLPKTCIDYDSFFPSSYRLSSPDECKKFFKILKSQEYADAKLATPVQYLIKVGADSHQGRGVSVLSEELERSLLTNYSSGSQCGIRKDNLIAQKYISNPLLIYNNQKFDFRIYVLIASTNPLIVYYRDGFVRVSLQQYDATTSEKQSHLTNSHLSDNIVNQAKTEEEKKKLLEMQLSTLQMLADDLEAKGRLVGEEEKRAFLENLRHKFKTAIAHIIRMSQSVLEKRSGSYRVMGFDFMLDQNLNLWFIEANNAPQMSQTEKYRRQFTEILIRDALEIEFALLRSRMKRVREFVQIAAEEYRMKLEDWDKEALREMFKEANKEKWEPEFQVSSTNTWEKIIDFSLSENEESAYLGNLDQSCFGV